MKSNSVFIISIIIMLIIVGCGKESEKQINADQPLAVQQIAQGTLGKVVEKINDGEGYTFVLVDSGKEKFWAAAPEFKVNVGSMVIVPEGTRLENFHNKPLNRDFEKVMFVDAISLAPADKTVSSPSAGIPETAVPSKK